MILTLCIPITYNTLQQYNYFDQMWFLSKTNVDPVLGQVMYTDASVLSSIESYSHALLGLAVMFIAQTGVLAWTARLVSLVASTSAPIVATITGDAEGKR